MVSPLSESKQNTFFFLLEIDIVEMESQITLCIAITKLNYFIMYCYNQT